MVRAVNQKRGNRCDRRIGRYVSQRQRDWDDVDGEKYGVGSRDKVIHVEMNDHLYVSFNKRTRYT